MARRRHARTADQRSRAVTGQSGVSWILDRVRAGALQSGDLRGGGVLLQCELPPLPPHGAVLHPRTLPPSWRHSAELEATLGMSLVVIAPRQEHCPPVPRRVSALTLPIPANRAV